MAYEDLTVKEVARYNELMEKVNSKGNYTDDEGIEFDELYKKVCKRVKYSHTENVD